MQKRSYMQKKMAGLIRCKETACSNSKLAGKINTYVH
jgi:ribosomal protein L32